MTYNVEPTQYLAIQQAILVIARDDCGITFTATKVGDGPTPAEVSDAGTPFLAVSTGQLAGFSNEGMGPEERGMGDSLPVWEFSVFVVYSYDQSNENLTPIQNGVAALFDQFMKHDDLGGLAVIQSPRRMNRNTYQIGGRFFIVIELVTRVIEELIVTPA